MTLRFRAVRDVSQPGPRVPAIEVWPERGISGLATQGVHTGQPVIAWRTLSPRRKIYQLWLPDEEIRRADGTLVSETDVLDRLSPRGSGIIYDVTRELGIEWSTDDSDFDAAVEWYRRRNELWADRRGEQGIPSSP